MFKIEKRFTIPMGHRLSKHIGGRCFSIHGHNFIILICVKSNKLNDNDMVIDFYDLKVEVNDILDDWDHALLLNETDRGFGSTITDYARIKYFPYDPTAEKLAEGLFKTLENELKDKYGVELDYVTIYENETSSATYHK